MEQLLLDIKYIDKDVAVEDFIDNSFVEKAHAEFSNLMTKEKWYNLVQVVAVGVFNLHVVYEEINFRLSPIERYLFNSLSLRLSQESLSACASYRRFS